MAPPFSYRIRFLVITFRSTQFMTSAIYGNALNFCDIVLWINPIWPPSAHSESVFYTKSLYIKVK